MLSETAPWMRMKLGVFVAGSPTWSVTPIVPESVRTSSRVIEPVTIACR